MSAAVFVWIEYVAIGLLVGLIVAGAWLAVIPLVFALLFAADMTRDLIHNQAPWNL